MKTIYCSVLVNANGDIEHCITSDAPLPDKNLIEDGNEYTAHYFSASCQDNDFVRARELKEALRYSNNQLEIENGNPVTERISDLTLDASRRRTVSRRP